MEFVPPRLGSPPYRAMAIGAPLQGWYESTDAERAERILPRMRDLLERWEVAGARLIASFDDDLLMAGPPSGPGHSIYVLFEVQSLDTLVEMVQGVRETVDGVRLDNYLRIEIRIGRPLFFASDGDGGTR